MLLLLHSIPSKVSAATRLTGMINVDMTNVDTQAIIIVIRLFGILVRTLRLLGMPDNWPWVIGSDIALSLKAAGRFYGVDHHFASMTARLTQCNKSLQNDDRILKVP